MKIASFSFLFLILMVTYVQSGIIIPSLKAFRESIINLMHEKNASLDIDYGGSRKLDVYYNKKDTNNLKPVVIFVHGGAWITGNKYEYSKLGSLVLNENYVGVLPGYVLFPKGTIDDMVSDIYKSIEWTYNNISKYGGDKDNIILSGHSAGAHLIALTLFKSTLKIKNQRNYLNLLPRIRKMVLFNGPYDFDDYDISRLFYSESEVDNGVTESLVSMLVNSRDISPTDILKPYADNSISDFGVSEIVVFNGGKDQLVPQSSAEHLIKQIRRVSPNILLTSVHKDDYDHLTLVFGAMSNIKEQEQLFLELVKI